MYLILRNLTADYLLKNLYLQWERALAPCRGSNPGKLFLFFVFLQYKRVV